MLQMVLAYSSEPLDWSIYPPALAGLTIPTYNPVRRLVIGQLRMVSKLTCPTPEQPSVTGRLKWGCKRPASLPWGRINSVVWLVLQQSYPVEATGLLNYVFAQPFHVVSYFLHPAAEHSFTVPVNCTALLLGTWPKIQDHFQLWLGVWRSRAGEVRQRVTT